MTKTSLRSADCSSAYCDRSDSNAWQLRRQPKPKPLDLNRQANQKVSQMLPMTDDAKFAIMLALASFLALAMGLFALRPKFRYSPYRFQFWDGARLREIETLKVLNGLEAQKDFRLYDHPRLAVGGNKAALRITGRTVRATFESPHLSDEACLRLLISFVKYAHAMKNRMGLNSV